MNSSCGGNTDRSSPAASAAASLCAASSSAYTDRSQIVTWLSALERDITDSSCAALFNADRSWYLSGIPENATWFQIILVVQPFYGCNSTLVVVEEGQRSLGGSLRRAHRTEIPHLKTEERKSVRTELIDVTTYVIRHVGHRPWMCRHPTRMRASIQRSYSRRSHSHPVGAQST